VAPVHRRGLGVAGARRESEQQAISFAVTWSDADDARSRRQPAGDVHRQQFSRRPSLPSLTGGAQGKPVCVVVNKCDAPHTLAEWELDLSLRIQDLAALITPGRLQVDCSSLLAPVHLRGIAA
jgi:hypothetical protein